MSFSPCLPEPAILISCCQMLGEKIKVLDKDGDGEISFDEVKEVIGKVMRKGPNTEEQHAQQLFDILDANKDGKGKSRSRPPPPPTYFFLFFKECSLHLIIILYCFSII
jgi:hypothetical protein